jgi:hypothetical protein
MRAFLFYPNIFTIKKYTSIINLKISKLTYDKDASGLDTVYLYHPTNYPQMY